MPTRTISGEHIARADTATDVITPLSREQRSLRASHAAHVSWAMTLDRAGRTAAARQARWERYVAKAREIHAGHDVSEEFIAQVAEHLRAADMRKMAYASAKARRRNKGATGESAA